MPGFISGLPVQGSPSVRKRLQLDAPASPPLCRHSCIDPTPWPHRIQVSDASNSRRAFSSCPARASCRVCQLGSWRSEVLSLPLSGTQGTQTIEHISQKEVIASRQTLTSFNRGFDKGNGYRWWRRHRRRRPSRAGSCYNPWGWRDRRQGGVTDGRPETSWVRARTRERHLGACLVPKAQRGASLFPSLRLTSSCVASHRPDPQGSHRAGKWEKTALQGDTEQSRGRAGAGAESPHAVTVLDTPSGLCDPPAATPWGSKTLKPLGA